MVVIIRAKRKKKERRSQAALSQDSAKRVMQAGQRIELDAQSGVMDSIANRADATQRRALLFLIVTRSRRGTRRTPYLGSWPVRRVAAQRQEVDVARNSRLRRDLARTNSGVHSK